MNPEGWPIEDVIDACDVLEATGRTIPREKWVDEEVARADLDSFRSLC